jgi:hypothetical protein
LYDSNYFMQCLVQTGRYLAAFFVGASMPRYIFELEGHDTEAEPNSYLVEFPNLAAARQEAQNAVSAWITYAEENRVPLELHQQFNIYTVGAELVAVVPFFPNSTVH